MNFERGLQILEAYALKANAVSRQDFELHKGRLLENLEDEGRFGPTQESKNTRARIIHQLNILAQQLAGISFTDLCLGKQPVPAAQLSDAQQPAPQVDTRGTARPEQADVVIVTAMREELEPVLKLRGGQDAWSTFLIDEFIHYSSRFEIGSRSLSVVACSFWKYGGDPTTAAVVRLKSLAPRLIVMTGICAGWESKGIHFGDVIVAERAFHVGEGKQTTGGFQPDPYTYQPPPWLVQWLRDFAHDEDWSKAIQTPRPRSLRYQIMWVLCRMHERPSFPGTEADWRELENEQIDYPRVVELLRSSRLVTQRGALTKRAQTLLIELRQRNYGKLIPTPDPLQPSVHYGTFASTSTIIAVENPFLEYAERFRSVRAIELEVASLFSAAAEIRVPAFAVKGVSDHATPEKDDAFHIYAAEAAARWADAFIQRYADQLFAG
jgi:nucleoside phosphorylase